MSPGKMAAQAAHASCLSLEYHFRVREDPFSDKDKIKNTIYDAWWDNGHYAKYVMQADNTNQMWAIDRYLTDREFKTFMVIDEGHTEGTIMVPTALGVELVDKDDERINSIFSTFQLYVEENTSRLSAIERSKWLLGENF